MGNFVQSSEAHAHGCKKRTLPREGRGQGHKWEVLAQKAVLSAAILKEKAFYS